MITSRLVRAVYICSADNFEFHKIPPFVLRWHKEQDAIKNGKPTYTPCIVKSRFVNMECASRPVSRSKDAGDFTKPTQYSLQRNGRSLSRLAASVAECLTPFPIQ